MGSKVWGRMQIIVTVLHEAHDSPLPLVIGGGRVELSSGYDGAGRRYVVVQG